MAQSKVLYFGTRTNENVEEGVPSTIRGNAFAYRFLDSGEKITLDFSDTYPRDYILDWKKEEPKYATILDCVKREDAPKYRSLWFEWGDRTSGSLRLAVSILDEYFGDLLEQGHLVPITAYYHFMLNVVKKLPYSAWKITEDEMRAWQNDYAKYLEDEQ